MTNQPSGANTGSDALIGKVLGNVRLVEVIGVGGMGSVFKGEHTTLKTPYAVKILHEKFSNDGEMLERFRREAMACSSLRHPNIVFVTDFGFHRDVGLYLVMEYLTGQTLQDLLNQMQAKRLPLWRAGDIGEQMCEAFEAAHNLGIIHRDLKPENIWLVERSSGKDLVKVLDFGIARLNQPLAGADAGEAGDLTRQNNVMGTPHYISPEQIHGSSKATPKADIYSLGVLLYEMIAGEPPLDSNNLMELLTKHVRQVPKPISAHRPELANTGLESLLAQMLKKRPEDRPPSMGRIGARLGEAIKELQERGIWDADPQPIAAQQASVASYSNQQFTKTGQFRLTGLIQDLSDDNSTTRLSQLYRALPTLNTLPIDLFYVATWGPIMRDLVDNPINSDAFKHSLIHFASILEGLLTTVETSEEIQEAHHLIASSIQELMQVIDQERQTHILGSFQHLTSHYLFPQHALPQWSTPQTEGSWAALKGVLTTDIRDLFKSEKHDNTHQTSSSTTPTQTTPQPTQEEGPSLTDKLKQDVSVDSIRSLLTHEIRLFKKKNKPS